MQLKLRPAFGMTMIWLVTVAGVSATAWFAIDQAGRDVGDPGVTSLATPSLAPTLITTSPSAGPTTEPTTAPSTSTTTAPTANATGSTSPSPSPSYTRQPSPVSSAAPRDRTVIVTGGQVSVRCTGAVITLRIAQPDNGWRVEVDGSGPETVEVAFQQGDTEGAPQAHVKAVCSSGTPVFTIDNSN